MKKIKNFYFFEDTIERVFGYLKDFKKTDSLFEDIRSATEITLGINTYEVSNKFHYTVNGVKINFEVLDYQEEEKLKSIKWLVSVAGTDIAYEYEYILHKCTVGGDVILEWNLIFKESTKIESDLVIKDLNECMQRIKKKLKTDLTDYYLAEAIIIRTDRSSIVKTLLNFPNLKVTQNIFGKVKVSGDTSQVGCKIVFELPFVGVESKFYVETADFNDHSYEWIYSLKSKASSSGSIPFVKEIIFTIIKISTNKNFLEIKHTFNQQISRDKLNAIKEDQLSFLKEIKGMLNEDKKDETKDDGKKDNDD
jgi:hypothetical protein